MLKIEKNAKKEKYIIEQYAFNIKQFQTEIKYGIY